MPKKWSIRFLLALLVVALAGPLLGLTAAFGHRVYRADRTRAEEELLALADAAAVGVAQFLHDSQTILTGMASTPAVRSLDPALCRPFLDGFAPTLQPTYINVATWKRDGTPVCSLLETPSDGLDMTASPGFREALVTDGFTITPVQRGQRSGRWSTMVTAPVKDSNGTHVGMVSLSVDLIRFQDIIHRVPVPDDGILSLTELGGTVVARSDDAERWVGSTPPASDARSRDDPTFTTRGSSRARTFDGRDFQWGFVRIPDTNWIVYAGRPFAAVFGDVWALGVKLLLLSGLVVLGATALGFGVYRAVTRPLQALVDGIAASPNIVEPLPTTGPSEIAWVAERFNRARAERTDAQEERAQADDRARSIFENASMGIAVVTEDGTFIDVNQALADLLGYPSRQALLATPVVNIYPTPDARRRHIEQHGHKDRFRGISTTWVRRDGEALHVRLSGRAVTFRDSRRGWEIFVEDLTEVTRLQERYAQLERMEALGRLAGGVAHDFNNLLTVVQGQADLLRDDPDLDEGVRQQVDEILRAAARGAALNRQLLAFGRRSPSDKKLLDLNRVVRDFELVLRRALGEEIALQVSLDPDAGLVKADRSRVEQILMNLMVNSRDAMPRGGTITLSTLSETVTAAEVQTNPDAQEGPHVVLAVKDTGTGITDDVLPHIFEPFFSTKPSSRGTGLGLATVYGIVADSGGHVRVRTRKDQGTEFRVYLPVTSGELPARDARTDRETHREGTGLILLAEDEAGVRRLAQQILERAGFRVVTAGDGREALIQAAGEPGAFDLLLTDVVMPGLRGPELAEALASSGKVRRAVLFSGYPDGLPDEGPPGIQVWRYLPKPFSADQLLDAVHDVLARPS